MPALVKSREKRCRAARPSSRLAQRARHPPRHMQFLEVAQQAALDLEACGFQQGMDRIGAV
jgi:hypothetical protein